MEQKDIDKMIKQVEDETGSKFSELFSREQQEKIVEMIQKLDKQIEGVTSHNEVQK